MKIKGDIISFWGNEEFDITTTDKEGYWHRHIMKKGKHYHTSNHPFCVGCLKQYEIKSWANGHIEMCPQCGQGSGSVW